MEGHRDDASYPRPQPFGIQSSSVPIRATPQLAGDLLPHRRRLDHFGLVAETQHPVHQLDGAMHVHRHLEAAAHGPKLLGGVPLTSLYVAGYLGMEPNPDARRLSPDQAERSLGN